MDHELNLQKRRRISRRIRSKGGIKTLLRNSVSRERLQQNNHLYKGDESEDGSVLERSGPLHLRFENGKTTVICKSGSFTMKRNKQSKREFESDVSVSICSTSTSPTTLRDDHRSLRLSKKEDPNDNDNENENGEASISEIVLRKVRERIPEKKIPPHIFKKRRVVPKRQAQKRAVSTTLEPSPKRRIEIKSPSNESNTLEKTKKSTRRDIRDTRRTRFASNNNIDKEHQTPKSVSIVDEKSWADKTAESQGAQCNAIQVIMIDLLRTIRRKCDPRGFFSAPVDPVEDECPDYFDVIEKASEAMDLGTIESYVRNGKLRDMKDFEHFINRIYKCAIKYNSDPTHFVYQKAEEFFEQAKPLMEQTRIRIQKMNGRRKSSLTGHEVPSQISTTSQETTHDLRETRSQKKNQKQNIERKKDTDEREDMSYISSSSKADSEFELLELSLRNRRERNYENSKRKRLRSRNNSSQGKKSTDRRLTRKRTNKALYVDETSDSEISEVSILEGADIPFCLKDLSDSETKSCSSRKEWLSLCPKLVMVCNEAARRSTLRFNPTADRFDKPLSETYIKERLQLGFPLRGCTIWTKPKDKRSPIGLQGFVVTTNFIAWRQTLRFTMHSPAAGLTSRDKLMHSWDDGSITQYMQKVPRYGEISDKGVVFSRVAEIALLGGLGCGSFLLRKAIKDLQETGEYDILLLQATKNAIPFYQKHGFVRIGAVARFNDELIMPEIAYRHWSEINDGEVVEASYMMALRLSLCTESAYTGKDIKPTEEPQKKIDLMQHDEILSSLSSAKKLLVEAVNLKMSLSSGGRPTFYELLSIAREFGKSANDTDLVAIIDRATKQCVGYTIQHSKSILRSSLNFPMERSTLHRIEMKDVKVNVNIDNEIKDVNGFYLKATVPSNLFTKKIKRDNVRREFVVHIKCNGEENFEGDPLNAEIIVPERTNSDEAREATAIAFHSIRRVANLAFNGGIHESWEELSAPNDTFLLQTEPYDSYPLWMAASVQRRCTKSELPKGTDFQNTFIVELSEGETMRETLDRSCSDFQRGVGRKWCSTKDWSAFSSLPIFILDMLLMDASVKYTDINGTDIEGAISKRIGGGLENAPRWRVKIENNKRNTRSSLTSLEPGVVWKDLEAEALRDYITIEDDKMKEVMSAIVSMGPISDKPEFLVSSFSWKGTILGKDSANNESDIENDQNEKSERVSEENVEKKPSESEEDEWVIQRMKTQMLGKFDGSNVKNDADNESDSLRSRKHSDRLRRKRNADIG